MANPTHKSVFATSLSQIHEEYGERVAEVLTNNLSGHNDAKDGFTPLEYDPVQYDFQRLDCISVFGKNASAEELRALAGIVYPQTEQVIDKIAKRKDLLNHAAYVVLNGGRFALMGDHYKSVIGIAVLGGAFICALYENTPVTPQDIDINIIASYFIKHTRLQGGYPTSLVLSDIFTRTTYTLPPSPTIKDTIPIEVREPVNTASIDFMLKNEIEGIEKDPLYTDESKGSIDIFAGSGSRDVSVGAHYQDKRYIPKTTHLGPLAFGTSEIVQQIPTIGVGIDMSKRHPKVYIGVLPPQPAKKRFEADTIMNEIARGMSTPTHPRIYHSSRGSFYSVIGSVKAPE